MNKEKINTEPKLNLNPDGFEAATATPFYECTSKGVYYHAFDTDRQGNIIEKPPLRLSDPIKLIGCGIDSAGVHYRVINWRDRFNNEQKTIAISMADIGTNWGMLQGMGIAIQSSRRKRDLLSDYLMTEGEKTPYIITNQAGWCDSNRAYILPSGKVLSSKKGTRVIYNGDTSQAQYYQSKGTLQEWQHHIARYAVGNSRLSLALGSAFAAPLMHLMDIEGGGFHLFGDSSDGKTTTAKVALSVWGKSDDLKLSWEGTGHGFANIANAKNDNLMVLDEIGQASPRVVAHTAYSVLNGTGKVQGAKEGGNRHINRWRVLVLSTGEKTMDTFTKSQASDWNAGQATRMPNIPASAGKGFGAFDIIHDMANGAELSEHLNHTSNEYYGIAGKAFIEHLVENQEAAIKHVREVMHSFNAGVNLVGQTRRVANRFALVAAALELANHYGVTGMSTGTASIAIKQCFDDWLGREGAGNREDRIIIEQTEAFMQQNAGSYRFIHWDDRTNCTDNLAGYRKYLGNELSDENSQEYWIIPTVFKDEICKTYDIKKVCDVLTGIEWQKCNHSQKTGEKRIKHRKYGKGYFYVLIGEMNPQDNQNDDDYESCPFE